LRQLQDFAKALQSVEDRAIESNYVATLQKRNKAFYWLFFYTISVMDHSVTH